MATYPYRPLDATKNEIRLLVLQPGEGDSIVEIEIVHEYLIDNPSYEALSYVWGTSTVTDNVHILAEPEVGCFQAPRYQRVPPDKAAMPGLSHADLGDKLASSGDYLINTNRDVYVFKATINLKSALQHLRLTHEPRVLWVDAVCINQKDSIEREQQVRQMDQIYRKCARVCIWPGEAADESDIAMDLTNNIEEECMLARLNSSDGNTGFQNTFVPAAEKLLEGEHFASKLRAPVSLISRPWFNRLWIVQEVVLASDRTVVCGHKTATWGLVFRTFLFLVYYRPSKSKSGGFIANVDMVFQNTSGEINQEWKPDATKLMRLGTMAINQDERSPPLRELLLELRGRGVTDKRDSVYGLLSLADDTSPMDWRIDYEIPPLEVFKVALKKEIEISQCLDIICDGPNCIHDNAPMPSWLPRFDGEELPCGCSAFQGSSLTYHDLGKATNKYKTSPYKASKGGHPNVMFDKQGEKLVTHGLLVDRIDSVMPRTYWAPVRGTEPDLIIPKQWFSWALRSKSSSSMQNEEDSSDSEELDSKKFDTLWRTMIGDRVPPSSDRAPLHIGEGLKHWLKHERGDLRVSPATALYRKVNFGFEGFKTQLYSTARHGQRLVTTENKFLGLGRGNSAPGDFICIIIGCSVPVILRRVADVEEEEYALIGESYIHGLMDGEAMDELKSGDYKLKEITLV